MQSSSFSKILSSDVRRTLLNVFFGKFPHMAWYFIPQPYPKQFLVLTLSSFHLAVCNFPRHASSRTVFNNCSSCFDLSSCFTFVAVTSSPTASHIVDFRKQQSAFQTFSAFSCQDHCLSDFIAALMFMTLYSPFTDCMAHPPFFLDTYNKGVDDACSFPPIVTTIFRASRSILLSSVSGECCVHMGYLRIASAYHQRQSHGWHLLVDKCCRYVFSSQSSVFLSS